MQEDMGTLNKMSQALLNEWKDNIADHFNQGCLGAVQASWKEFYSEAQPLMRQLKQIEQHMNELKAESRKVQQPI